MELKIARNRKLAKELGAPRTRLLVHGANSIERLLPHIETLGWKPGAHAGSSVKWRSKHRSLLVSIAIGDRHSVQCEVRRRQVPEGVGSISRTLSERERDICLVVVNKLTDLLKPIDGLSEEVCQAIGEDFDELVVAEHLKTEHGLVSSPAGIFRSLRELAGQTYENKAITFGCVINAENSELGPSNGNFPKDFLKKKRYRALSDGYFTTYVVSSAGCLLEFRDVTRAEKKSAPRSYFPDWCGDLAALGNDRRLAVKVSSDGDLGVFVDGDEFLRV